MPDSPKKKSEERHQRLSKIETVAHVLEYAGPKPDAKGGKGPFGARLSDGFAVLFARGLRARGFEGTLPREDGTGVESRARTAKGFKKLDVNYSKIDLGLALGVSIKTINYRDPGSERYTKNYSRVDYELRAEAMDYHERQPYAVLAGVLFLPADACGDATKATKDEEAGTSSFGAAVKYFRIRAPRMSPREASDLFERFFVGTYELERDTVAFYDVNRPRPPRDRPPAGKEVLSLDEVLDEILRTYDERNNPPFTWA